MAFTFIVETGAGVDGANAYCTVAEADDINAIDINSTWDDLDTPTKQKLLAYATRWIDENCYFMGSQTDKDQALRWPRTGTVDRDRHEYAGDVIPTPIKQVTARLAAVFNETHPEDMEMARGVRRFRADLVEVEWQDGFAGKTAPGFVSTVLAGIGYGPDDRGGKGIIKK